MIKLFDFPSTEGNLYGDDCANSLIKLFMSNLAVENIDRCTHLFIFLSFSGIDYNNISECYPVIEKDVNDTNGHGKYLIKTEDEEFELICGPLEPIFELSTTILLKNEVVSDLNEYKRYYIDKVAKYLETNSDPITALAFKKPKDKEYTFLGIFA